MTAAAPALDPLEVASGLVLGVDEPPGPPERARGQTPRAALEHAVLAALQRPPCLVSFSGGRDSSAVLAVAALVARREGLPSPVPATNRFPEAPQADETAWQERVVRRLGLDDWLRLDHTTELETLGPVANRALERHGLLWPFNAHFHVPILRAARGGSVLTGIGGDELLSISAAGRVHDVLRGRVRPEPRDVLRLGFQFAPPMLRRHVLRRRELPLAYSWLRPPARAALADAWARQNASQPTRWRAMVGWVRNHRYLRIGTAGLALLAEDEGVTVRHPFLDAGVVGAVADLGRGSRFTDRDAAMRALFADLLPEEILARETKASFDEAFWSTAGRTFASEWDGEGVDHDLVDAERLKAEWCSDSPDPRSFTLAQAAWLSRETSAGSRVEQTVHGRDR